MIKNTTIESKVEAALNSLDGMRSASPGPFFFTRVQARLQREEKNVWEKMIAFVCRPAVAITMTCLVITINAAVIFQHKESPRDYSTSALADQTDQSVYEEFNVASNSFYEFEIKEP
jgi:hypothetical protein